MKMKNRILTYILLSLPLLNIAQETPGSPQEKSILLLNGTAHLGTGEVIKRAAIGFENGTITLVADALTTTIDESKFDTVINIKDKHVYPGFIAPNSTLGLQEIGSVRATRDQRETGTYNPHVRSLVAYNTDSDITPTIRTNGVLMAQITPRGGRVSGTSSVVHFDAWNWEDAVLRTDDGIHLNWPNSIQKSGWWAEPGPASKSKRYEDQKNELDGFFKKAFSYYELKNHAEKDLRYAAMEGIFDGSKTLYVHGSLYKEINDIIQFKKEFGIKNLTIVGGYDAHLLAKQLNENEISVILQRVHSLPERPEDDVYENYKLASKLSEKNVLFCLENAGDMEQMGTRNLPFYAGTAVAYGLPYEEAVKSISLNAAKILGIEKHYGSLEKGKSATLFVSEGDALDMRSNELLMAFVQGRTMSLDNHQKRNYEKYKEKYQLD